MINAMNMFDVGNIDAGLQSGMQIGQVNSPFAGANSALKDALTKYNAHLATMQQQANALDLEKAKYGYETGQKQAYSKAAMEAAAKLRAQTGVDSSIPTLPITYANGARYQPDPMGTNRQLISNVVPDDVRGTADWGPWSYAPAEDTIGGMVEDSMKKAGKGAQPRVNWPLGGQPQSSPLPGVPVANGARPPVADPYAGMTPTEKRIAQTLGI